VKLAFFSASPAFTRNWLIISVPVKGDFLSFTVTG
jgi:hypothetical protein